MTQTERYTQVFQFGVRIVGLTIKKNEMGGACSTMGRGKVYTWFSIGNVWERDNLEDPGIDGRIILS